MTGPETIFDLFFDQVYRCKYCDAFRVSKAQIRAHVRSMHGEAVREEVDKGMRTE